jgi:hypothetical protein
LESEKREISLRLWPLYRKKSIKRAKMVDEPDSYDYRSGRYYINNIEDSITIQNPYFGSFGNSIQNSSMKNDAYAREGVE